MLGSVNPAPILPTSYCQKMRWCEMTALLISNRDVSKIGAGSTPTFNKALWAKPATNATIKA